MNWPKIEEITYSECDNPDSTVRTRLARGREQLAKYYAETEEGGGRK